MTDSTGRILRTILQLVAAGVLEQTGLIDQIAGDLNSGYTLPIYFLVVVVAQNLLEEFSGKGIARKVDTPRHVGLLEDDPKGY